jgi:hypothetical protein
MILYQLTDLHETLYEPHVTDFCGGGGGGGGGQYH